MKKVEVSTDVARGVHNSHQRVNQSSKSPAGFFTRPVFLKLPGRGVADELSASIRARQNHEDVAASWITTRTCQKLHGNS
jgi:hypothetical protein